jgi:hypothetical protein
MDPRSNVVALKAGVAVTANRIVYLSGNGLVSPLSALGDTPYGVALNSGAAGATIYVQTRGRCYVAHSAVAITAATTVGVDTGGRAVTKSLTTNPETVTIGTALNTSSAVVDELVLIDLDIQPRGDNYRVMIAGAGGCTAGRVVSSTGEASGIASDVNSLADVPLGVALNTAAAAETVVVQVRGRCYVSHTAVAITVNDTVGVDTAGRAVGKSLTLNPETVTIGTCLETSSDVLDEQVYVELNIIQRDSSQRVMLAGKDLTAGHAVMGTDGASNDAMPLVSTDSIPIGVALNTAAQNETVIVQVTGVVRMKATDVAQVQGDITGYTEEGRASKLVSGGATDNYPLGHNLTTTTGVLDEDVIVALSIGGVQV